MVKVKVLFSTPFWKYRFLGVARADNSTSRNSMLNLKKKSCLLSSALIRCGPCKNLGPRLEAKVCGQNGKVFLATVNVDSMGELADQFQVNAVPTGNMRIEHRLNHISILIDYSFYSVGIQGG